MKTGCLVVIYAKMFVHGTNFQRHITNHYLILTQGTTSGIKYIPITKESLPEHFKASKNAMLLYINETGNTDFLSGKLIFLQGSPALDTNGVIKTGRLSGISAHHVPKYLQSNRLPSWETNCIEDWETKVDKIIEKSKEDSILRQLVDNEDKYNLENINKNKDFYLLSAPISGAVSQNYCIAADHLAIDISVDIGTPVKSVSNGRVILSEWTTQTGYVLIIDHGNDLISVYKHNSKLLKLQGEIVKQGEIIALSGNSGVLTSGPHLHFELWSEGFSIDPNTLINFE